MYQQVSDYSRIYCISQILLKLSFVVTQCVRWDKCKPSSLTDSSTTRLVHLMCTGRYKYRPISQVYASFRSDRIFCQCSASCQLGCWQVCDNVCYAKASNIPLSDITWTQRSYLCFSRIAVLPHQHLRCYSRLSRLQRWLSTSPWKGLE